MELEVLQGLAAEFMAGLPDKIADTLEDVDVILCQTPEDGTAELVESLDPTQATPEQKALCTLPADCKGVFIGDPMERSDDGEDSEEETIYDPSGVIAIVASNVASKEDFVLCMLHEMGHALGLDEEGVKALGLAVSSAAQSAAAEKGNPDAAVNPVSS